MFSVRVHLLPALLLTLLSAGCSSYRIEYHKRPEFYQQASDRRLPDQVALQDGTIVRYNHKPGMILRDDDDSDQFEIRSVSEDGRITLRARTPEHVIANLMTCIRNEEYELIYSQVLSEQARVVYENESGSRESFIAFCRANRRDLMITLNRLSFGFTGQDVVLRPVGDGVLRAGFSPRVAESFRFKTVEFINERGTGMKLHSIR